MINVISVWVLVGLVVGILGWIARFQSRANGRLSWWRLLLLGVVSATIGGLLAERVLGPYFTVLTALWTSVLCVILGPYAWYRWRTRRQARGAGIAPQQSNG